MGVYNGDDTIDKAIRKIFQIDYPHDHFEIIVVDDHSTDSTYSILKSLEEEAKQLKINFQVLRNRHNLGRIKTRLKGFKRASFQRVLILDVRSMIEPNTLKKASKYSNNTSLISNYYTQKDNSLDDRILYLLRRRYYQPYWGRTAPIELTEKNFNKVPKGTGGFITNRDEFIHFSEMLEGRKNESDDTKIFRKYIENGKHITRVSDVKILYVNRNGIASLKHLYHRGPRFVDYYFHKVPKYFRLLALGHLVLGLLIITSAIVDPVIVLTIPLLAFLVNLAISLYLAENVIDFLSVFFYFPVLAFAFYLGVLKGLFIKLRQLTNI